MPHSAPRSLDTAWCLDLEVPRVHCSQRGFTLIELLTVVSIIGIVIALTLPAVQSAARPRGTPSARTISNKSAWRSTPMRARFGTLPPGRMMTYDPRFTGSNPPCTSVLVEKSLFLQMTPQLDQSPLFNAINQSLTIFGYENQTARTVALSSFACPSDPDAGTVRGGYSLVLYSYGLAGPDESYLVYYSSYAGVYGSCYVSAIPSVNTNCSVAPSVLAEANGSFNDVSPIRLSSISDGLSFTAAVTERALAPLKDIADANGSAYDRYGWLIAGNWGDTLVTAFYPPNMYRKVSLDGNISQYFAASSLHPGGVNVLMGDGSVRFVKDSIQTWPFDLMNGAPIGSSRDTHGAWVNLPPSGVWQALSTRNGGEVVAGDSY